MLSVDGSSGINYKDNKYGTTFSEFPLIHHFQIDSSETEPLQFGSELKLEESYIIPPTLTII